LDSSRELCREQHDAELRDPVRAHPAVLALAVEVVEVKLAAVDLRGHVDDAAGRGGDEQRQQQVGEQKRRQVIDRPGQLESIGAQVA
jgi:hypothetical protein